MNENFTKFLTRPPYVQTSGSSRRCHWCGSQALHGKAGCPERDKICRKCNLKGHFQGVYLIQKRVAAMDGYTESGDAYVVANLSYKRRQRRIILAKVNSVPLHFVVDLGVDITVVN